MYQLRGQNFPWFTNPNEIKRFGQQPQPNDSLYQQLTAEMKNHLN
jgi:hypothetical protein